MLDDDDKPDKWNGQLPSEVNRSAREMMVRHAPYIGSWISQQAFTPAMATALGIPPSPLAQHQKGRAQMTLVKFRNSMNQIMHFNPASLQCLVFPSTGGCCIQTNHGDFYGVTEVPNPVVTEGAPAWIAATEANLVALFS